MPKIYLRNLSAEDASISFNWRNDPEIWRYTGHKPDKYINEQIERQWIIDTLAENNSYRFAIIADDHYVGNIQITDIVANESGQYHIFIGEKSQWGKGIGKLATEQLIRIARDKLFLKTLYLNVNPQNTFAIKLYERCGFEKVNGEILMYRSLSVVQKPIVSVFVMTYNHELYISEALESILMQKTSFDYEIVVGDDCSTDNTGKILLDFDKFYPGKFKLLLHDHNIGAIANQIEIQKKCIGKYIAFCEGDDFWTDPYKLQKQKDFLEENPNYIMCFHNASILTINDHIERTFYKNLHSGEYNYIYFLANDSFPLLTSILSRNDQCIFQPIFKGEVTARDIILILLLLERGNAYYLDEVMSCRRLHDNGIWSSLSSYDKLITQIKIRKEYLKYFKHHKYESPLSKNLINKLFILYGISIKNHGLLKLFLSFSSIIYYSIVYGHSKYMLKTFLKYFSSRTNN